MKRRLLLRRLISVGLLTGAVTLVAWGGLAAGVFVGFQSRATDALFPAAPHDKRVVVVGVDPKSIQAVSDPLPWPRSRWAQLVDRLSEAGAAVIAFDATFRGPDEDEPNDDILFADAIKRAGNVVLAIAIDKTITPDEGPPQATLGSLYGEFAEVAAGVAHVQVTQDPADGVVRRVPLVIDIEEPFVLAPALSAAAVATARGETSLPTVRPDGVQFGDHFMPTDDATNMLLNWTADLSDPPEEISAIDVLDGTADPAKLRDKIVFVGATDPLSGDLRLAPTDKSGRLPGVFLHANAANTMLTATFLEPASDASTLGWVALLTFLVGLAVVMLPFWLSPVIAIVLALGYVVFTFARLDNGTILNLVYPLVAIVIAFVAAMGIRYFGETRQRRRVTALFSQYVPDTVAQRLVDEDRAELAAEGQRLDMTVLFCDLRGFTALSEHLPPATVRVMLDHYYDRVTELVLDMRGTLMKYVGDEVFAVWGAPIPSTDHAERALACAMAIQAVTPQLNAELLEKEAPEVSFGIGLNSGEAVAAHFGGRFRRQYDVVGDTVNVGARLCSAAGRGEIIISDQLLNRVPNPPPVDAVGRTELKGVSREITLWRVRLTPSGTVDPTDPAGGVVAGAPPEAAEFEGERDSVDAGEPGPAVGVTPTQVGGVRAGGLPGVRPAE